MIPRSRAPEKLSAFHRERKGTLHGSILSCGAVPVPQPRQNPLALLRSLARPLGQQEGPCLTSAPDTRRSRRAGPAVLLAAALWGSAAAQGGLPFPALPLPGPAPAQTDALLRPLIPDLIVLRRPAVTEVTFDLGPANYPPAQFPARYFAPAQAFGVFSSSARPWTVQLEVRSQPDVQGRTLPLPGLNFRVNGGPWVQVTPGPQVVLSGSGPSAGWLPLSVEFALDLTGAEAGGGYLFDMTFTALALP